MVAIGALHQTLTQSSPMALPSIAVVSIQPPAVVDVAVIVFGASSQSSKYALKNTTP